LNKNKTNINIMKTRFKVTKPFKAVIFVSTSLALLSATLMPFLLSNRVLAAAPGEVTSRSIQMYDSTPGATTTYVVSFTTASTSAIQGIVVDYCSTDPLLGDTCNPAPSGFATGTTVTGTSGLGTMTGGTWTAASANGGRTFEYYNGGAGGSVGSSTPISITITGNVNPNTTCSTVSACEFYARIFTFATTGNLTTWLSTTDGSGSTGIVDFGGIAMTTVSNVIVNAKVQEMINFCVYTGLSCGSGSGVVTLGNAEGVLSASTAYLDNSTTYSIQTNAHTGAVINVEGPTLTYSGTATITNLTSPTLSATGNSQFGLCTFVDTGTTITPVGNYNGGGSTYCHDAIAPSTPGVHTLWYYGVNATTAPGDAIANVVAGSAATGTVVYLANISAVQQAGIYTSAQIYIATGTY
jgi:hypothetical protein